MELMVKKGIRAILDHKEYKEKKARKVTLASEVFKVCRDRGESRESRDHGERTDLIHISTSNIVRYRIRPLRR